MRRSRHLPGLALLLAVGCASAGSAPGPVPGWPDFAGSDGPVAVGFDLDDTLIFSSPGFIRARATHDRATEEEAFWTLVNRLDPELSTVKPVTLDILRRHRARGDELYVITARHPHGSEPLTAWIEATFGIPPERVFFETEGKAERIRALGLAVYYGDSDADITAAQEAGARAVRILRSPDSSYTKKFHPGHYGETVVEGSAD